MRYRLVFYATIAAIVAANALVIALGSMRSAAEACSSRLADGFLNPTGPCVISLSRDGLQAWWKKARDSSEITAEELDRRQRLERCKIFRPAQLIGDPSFCSNELLVRLVVARIDWQQRIFVSSTFGDGATPAAISDSNLTDAAFLKSSMVGSNFFGSILYGARFHGGDLSRASFLYADLRDVEILDADVTGTRFAGANLNGMIWQPKSGTLPDIAIMASAMNLQGLWYHNSPQQLVELREAFYKAGMTEQAQKVTYAIERTRRVLDEKSREPMRQISGWFRFVAFEKTAGYGMYPFRPLILIVLLIPLFAPLYLFATWHHETGGLWIRTPDGAIGRQAPPEWLPLPQVVQGLPLERFARYAGFALWYSIICAFRIGYKDVNVGDWITRLQPTEYLLGATGWCRTVAGIQSLLSVYLLALTVLCIIGRPFG